jgi:magnesium-protoporphyrin O-methyltransferase
MNACGCDGFASIFDERVAARDRDRYRRSGPDRTTRMLLEMLIARGVEGASVLDVGGGIGVVDHELLRAGAARAVLVDASGAYVEVARREATNAGVSERMSFVRGDFRDRATDIDAADVVTLDRVVCCYPDAAALVGLSAERARRLYGLVLPRDGWHTRLAIRLVNLAYRLRRSPYRAYAHANGAIDRLVAERGLRPTEERRTLVWRVVVYERP